MKRQENSIRFSMIKSIILVVLLPLFAALLVFSFLIQRTTSQSTIEAYRLMFDQNVREIDSAILQANYVSSTMITYTENEKLLKSYYQTTSAYEKSVIAEKMIGMISNCNVSNLGAYNGKLMILLNDGRLISSEKSVSVGAELTSSEWYRQIRRNKTTPYWDEEIGLLFDSANPDKYVSFGRELIRYGETSYGIALISIPRTVFTRFKDDIRYRRGDIYMFTPDGRLLCGNEGQMGTETILELFAKWKDGNQEEGRYDGYYVMGGQLTYSQNIVLYIGRTHAIFSKSERILGYLITFMGIITLLAVAGTWRISCYITRPIQILSDKIGLIEQNDPAAIAVENNRFRETRDLERGMLKAQQRIHLLVEEVRSETMMKERARFDVMKAQIRPHFLFNTLNAILWKASINGDEEVAAALSDLGILLSETYKSDDELETIEKAIYTLKAYVKIMEIRFGHEIEFFIVVPEDVQKCLIPRFCLQPLVENSFIHGMRHMERGVIALRGGRTGKDIELTLIDNGEGLQGKTLDLSTEERSEQNKKGITGIGLSNIHHRIQMLYGEQYGLTVDQSFEMGFRITLRIPATEQDAGEDEGTDC